VIARWISLLLLFSTAPASGHAQKRCYNALEFGAVGDGKTINTRSIQQAIDKATSSGGGSVCVPAGTFVTGALRLHSNVDLHLESGAILKGSGRLEDYYLDGKLVGLLFTQDAVNVSITGQGTIDDNGDSFMGLHWGKVRQLFSLAALRFLSLRASRSMAADMPPPLTALALIRSHSGMARKRTFWSETPLSFESECNRRSEFHAEPTAPTGYARQDGLTDWERE